MKLAGNTSKYDIVLLSIPASCKLQGEGLLDISSSKKSLFAEANLWTAEAQNRPPAKQSTS